MKTSIIAAVAVTLGLTLQMVKPDKHGKKQLQRPPSPEDLSNVQTLLSNMQALRKRTHLHIAKGTNSAVHAGNNKTILKLLHDTFTTEII